MSRKKYNKIVPSSHLPYSEVGKSSFSAKSITGYEIMPMAEPLVLMAIESLAFKECGPITICNYGTADGEASMPLLTASVDAIRAKYGKDKEIAVCFEDRPSNDFNSIIGRIHGVIPGPRSHIATAAGVYTVCTGTNFYEKCLPAKSIHLGISVAAMHCMSKRPGMLSDTIHYLNAKNLKDVNPWRKQAAQDWETILLARSHELVEGGQLVIVCPAIDERGQSSGNAKRIKYSLNKRLDFHWFSMMKDGIITEVFDIPLQEEFKRTSFNEYFRSKEEFSAPFNDPNSRVSKARLKLLTIRIQQVPCLFQTRWVTDAANGIGADAKAHAKRYVECIRTWGNSTFRAHLDSSRSEEEKDAVVKELYIRYQTEVAAAPEDHGLDYIHAYIHIEKAPLKETSDMDIIELNGCPLS